MSEDKKQKSDTITVQAGGSLLADKTIGGDGPDYKKGGQPVLGSVQWQHNQSLLASVNYSIVAPHQTSTGDIAVERPPAQMAEFTGGKLMTSTHQSDKIGFGGVAYVGAGVRLQKPLAVQQVNDETTRALNQLATGIGSRNHSQSIINRLPPGADRDAQQAELDRHPLPDYAATAKQLAAATQVPDTLQPWLDIKGKATFDLPIGPLETRLHAGAAMSWGAHTNAIGGNTGVTIGHGLNGQWTTLGRSSAEAPDLGFVAAPNETHAGDWSAGFDLSSYNGYNPYLPKILTRFTVKEKRLSLTGSVTDRLSVFANHSWGDNPSTGVPLPIVYRRDTGPTTRHTSTVGLSYQFKPHTNPIMATDDGLGNTPALSTPGRHPVFTAQMSNDNGLPYLLPASLTGRDPNLDNGGETAAASFQLQRDSQQGDYKHLYQLNGTMVTPHLMVKENFIPLYERSGKGVLDASYGRVYDRHLPVGATNFDLRTYAGAVVGWDDTKVTPHIQDFVHSAFNHFLGGRAVGSIGECKLSTAKNGPHAGLVGSAEMSKTLPVTSAIDARIGAFVNGEVFVDTTDVQGYKAGGGLRATIGHKLSSQSTSVPMANAEGFAPTVTPNSSMLDVGGWSLTASASASAGDSRFMDGAVQKPVVKSFAFDATASVSSKIELMAGLKISDNPSNIDHFTPGATPVSTAKNVVGSIGIRAKF